MGAALVAAGLKAAQMAGVQEKAEVALGQAMKTAGTFTEAALKHNLEYASSLQKITIFGDETILSVQKLLTNYGAQGDQLDELTKSTLDFATATGMSLEGAAALVGKTIGSTTNALTRYGIAVDGAVGSNERMQSAVEGITRLFGGAAQAEAKTYLGRLQQLNNRWGDFIEKVGFQVIPVVTEFISVINTKVLPALEGWIGGLSASGKATKWLLDIMKLFITTILGVKSAFQLAGDATAIFALGVSGHFAAAKIGVEEMKQKIINLGDTFTKIQNFEIEKMAETETAKTAILKQGTAERTITENAASLQVTINMIKELRKREDANRAFSDSLASAWSGSMAQFILEGGKASVAIKNIWDDIRRFVINMIAQMIAKWITWQVLTGGTGIFLGMPAFANGVKNFRGGAAIVGDDGPEIVNLPRGSDVISAPETRRIMGSGGGDIIIQNDLSGAVFTEGRIEETLGQINEAVKNGVFEGNELVKTVSRRSSELSEEA